MDDPTSTVAGVDGCRDGWVVATEHAVVVIGSIAPLLHASTELTTIGVDMPIGLPVDDARACDGAARAFLGARRSTVFSAPARACLRAADYPEALQLSRAAMGTGLSMQTFHLLAKIREVDGCADEAMADRLVEIHPECAFATMNGVEPLAPKRTSSGERRRTELLARLYGPLPPTPRGARRDDVLDALAVLWSAHRFRDGTHHTFGDGARDERGLPMRIVC